jgi:hypothetical protein
MRNQAGKVHNQEEIDATVRVAHSSQPTRGPIALAGAGGPRKHRAKGTTGYGKAVAKNGLKSLQS